VTNLVDADGGDVGDGMIASDGSLVLDGESGVKLKNRPVLSLTEASIAVDVTQSQGSFGYILAQSNPRGNLRYYGLYSTNNRITLYYVSGGVRESTHFRIAVNDGQRHRLLLTFADDAVTLLVDSQQPLTATLKSRDVCVGTETQCPLTLGHRSSNDGNSYFFKGIIHSATILRNHAVESHPSVNFSSRGSFPIISNSDHEHSWMQGQRILRLIGTSGLRVNTHDYIAGSSFSVAMSVRQLPGSSGYLFAKATASGSRFYSLYAGSDNTVRFYYRIKGSGATRRRTFKFNIGPSPLALYRVLLSVKDTGVSLFIDDVQIGSTVDMGGVIDDCGFASSNCILNIGERPSPSGGLFRWAGIVYDARFINNEALSLYPA